MDMNIIVKLKNKTNELKYKNADFCIIKDFSKNTEEILVHSIENEAMAFLVANRENVEYIYLEREAEQNERINTKQKFNN